MYINLLIGLLLLFSCNNEVDLSQYEKKKYSDGGEDGAIEKIFETITPTHKYFVDIGAADGKWSSNTRYLLEKYKWRGLLIEGNKQSFNFLKMNMKPFEKSVKLLHEWVFPGNIETIFEQNNVPVNFDFLKIDIDSNDYYLWKVLNKFKPKVVLIEFNPHIPVPEKKVIKYHPFNYWDGSEYFGASIQALYELGKSKGYELIYSPRKSINAFFVQKKYAGKFKKIKNLSGLVTADKWKYGSHTFRNPTFEMSAQKENRPAYDRYKEDSLKPEAKFLKYDGSTIKKEFIELK